MSKCSVFRTQNVLEDLDKQDLQSNKCPNKFRIKDKMPNFHGTLKELENVTKNFFARNFWNLKTLLKNSST